MFKKNNEDQLQEKQNSMTRTSARLHGVALFVVMLALAFGVLNASAAISYVPAAWDPSSSKWTSGNNSGFFEGDTAPLDIFIKTDGTGVVGNTYDVTVCLQVEAGGAYGFIAFEPWNLDYQPTFLHGGNRLEYRDLPPDTDPGWHTTNTIFYGYMLDVNYATGPTRGIGTPADCPTDNIKYLVNFTIDQNADQGATPGAWLFFGGRLAKAGDPIPLPPDTTTVVPNNQGANAVRVGNFTYKLGGANETINFKGGNNVIATTTLLPTKSCPDFSVSNSNSYIITVTNSDPGSTADPITISDNLASLVGDAAPLPLKLDGVTSSQGLCGSLTDTGLLVCNLGSLDPGDSLTVTLNVTINDNIQSGTNIQNSAVVNSPQDGPVVASTDTDCDTPVSLSYFKAIETDGGVSFDWSTATESGNLGFNILAVTDEGTVQLNEELIPSKTISSVDNQDYSLTVGNVDADTFLIQSVDVRGMVEQRGAYQLGEVYGQRLEPDLIDWGAIRAESEIKASLRQGALLGDPVENSARPARKSNSLTAADTASTVNLTIDEDGLYRVSFLRLKNAGLDLHTVPANEIALTNQGQSIPVYVGDGFIEFYGEALDTLYTADNVYTVQVDAALAKQVLQNYQTPRRKATPAEYYMETLIFDENKVMMDYISSTDPWINSYLFTQSGTVSQSYPFSGVDNYLAGLAPVNFTADLWGGYRNKQHNVQSELNGTLLAEKSFSGVQKYVVETELPEGVLQNGENTFTVTAGNGERELVFFDKLSIAYPRAFVARDGQLTFTEKGEVFAVNNLRSRDVIVYRISDNMTERMMSLKRRGTGHETYSATFSGKSSEAKYVVADAAAIKTPVAIIKADPQVDISSGSVNTLIIAHPDFIGTDLDRLADTRRAQGYSVKIVDVNQVYVQYGDNIFDAQAIKKYLTHALENMDVQMVLLVGGDTYDYRNYIGNSISFIPSLYAQTDDLIKFAPVDPWYVDPDGDKVPNAVIGRLPVRNSIELSNLVEKTETYIANGYTSTAVFSADTNYTYDSIELAGMMPEGWSVAKANIGEVGVDAARETLISSINEGVALASYFGHSADDQWSFEGLFTLNDAIALNNVGKPTVVTQYGCWNTYYVAPKANTLGHKLLLGENGAAAVTGATTLTSAVSEAKLGELMMPALVSGKTIGEAMLESKEALALTDPGLIDVQLGWTILGIPWLEVK